MILVFDIDLPELIQFTKREGFGISLESVILFILYTQIWITICEKEAKFNYITYLHKISHISAVNC